MADLKAMTRQIKPDFNIDYVHRRVFDDLAAEHGWSAITDEARAAIQRTWHALDARPDFPAALTRLRQRHAVASFTILSTALILDVSRDPTPDPSLDIVVDDFAQLAGRLGC